MEQYKLIYSILSQKGIGRVKANKIIQSFEKEMGNGEIETTLIRRKLNTHFTSEQIDDILKSQIDISMTFEFHKPIFINRFNEHYPNTLKDLKSNCPPILSCLGNISLLKEKKVGFCGSRKASEKGLNVAKDVSQQVAKQGIVIVSGYASGIDQETHYWALKEGGATILVIPEGINHFTIKKYLKDVWDWNRILVISEFIPNAIWSVNRAMERNTTIVALSDIMFLIEAKINGGSIDAGYKTLQMNKPLFAPVYSDMPEEASGNQLLLTKGALALRKKRDTDRANLDIMLNLMLNSGVRKKNLFE